MPEPFIVTIRPGVAFAPAAAASWRRMEKAVGRLIDVNSSYRNYAQQLAAYNAYQAYVNGTGPWAPYALHPDRSMHCKGLAVDTDDQSIVKAMPSHGWRQTALGIGEPWHFDYFATLDKHQGEPADGGSVPLPTPEPEPVPEPESEEDDMRIVFGHRDGGTPEEWMIVHPDLRGPDDKQLGYIVTQDPNRARAWGRMYKGGQGDYDFNVPRDQYIQIQEAARQVAVSMTKG